MSKRDSQEIGNIGETRFRRFVAKAYEEYIAVPPKRVVPKRGRNEQERGADYWLHQAMYLGDIPIEAKTHEWTGANRAVIALSDFSKHQREQLSEHDGWVWLSILDFNGKRRHADFLFPWEVFLATMQRKKFNSIKAREFMTEKEANDGKGDGAMAIWRARPNVIKALIDTALVRQLLGAAHTADYLGWHSDPDYADIAQALKTFADKATKELSNG